MLVYGQDALVADWVWKQLRLRRQPSGLYKAIGIAREGRLIAGVVWHNYHLNGFGMPLLIEVSLATVDKRWCSRHTLAELFSYPFTQLGVGRVQATCHRKAKRVRTTLKRLGFSFEGIAREAHPLGGDAAHYSMLRNECFWLKENGKRRTISPSGTRSRCHGIGADCQQ